MCRLKCQNGSHHQHGCLYRDDFDGIWEIAAIAMVSAFVTRMGVALRNVAVELFPGVFIPGVFIPGLIPVILHAISDCIVPFSHKMGFLNFDFQPIRSFMNF